MSRILTVEQVAEKLQVKPLTVRDYLRKGMIPGRKLGRSWRVVESDLEWFISGRSAVPPGERVSALGFLAHVPGFSSEQFMAEKRAEVEREERKWRERQRSREPKPRQGEAA